MAKRQLVNHFFYLKTNSSQLLQGFKHKAGQKGKQKPTTDQINLKTNTEMNIKTHQALCKPTKARTRWTQTPNRNYTWIQLHSHWSRGRTPHINGECSLFLSFFWKTKKKSNPKEKHLHTQTYPNQFLCKHLSNIPKFLWMQWLNSLIINYYSLLNFPAPINQ